MSLEFSQSPGEPITHKENEVTKEWASQFSASVLNEFSRGMVPTFATVFRSLEMEMVNRLGVDWRNLLHTEQEFEYHSSFEIGDQPKTVSRLKDKKVRVRGPLTLAFYLFESSVFVGETLRVILRTTFLVRTQNAPGNPK